jgi:hypothetical protein
VKVGSISILPDLFFTLG